MKAYDPKELIQEAKAQGLDLAEEAAELLAKSVFSWLKKSAEASENKIDDVLALGYKYAEEEALKLIDKIDGAQG